MGADAYRAEREGLEAFLPSHNDLRSVEEIERVRGWLPKLRAGDHLQVYKWALSCKARRVRCQNALGPRPTYVNHRALIEAAGSHCQLCGEPMQYWVNRRQPTLDHIVPLSKGGTNEVSNLRVICNICNSRRGNRADPSAA